ncbi:MAG: hypothetical protein ACR2P7_10015 [bacterium]
MAATQKLRNSGLTEQQSEAIVGGIVESQTDLATKVDLTHLEERMDTKIDRLEEMMDTKIDHLEQKMDAKFAASNLQHKADIADLKNAILLQGGGMMLAVAGLALAVGRFIF